MGGKPAGHISKDRDRKKQLAGADGFPADHGHAPATSGGGKSAVNGLKASGGFFVRASGGQESGTRRRAGGGKIAEDTSEGFATDEESRGGAEKVDPLHHRVGF